VTEARNKVPPMRSLVAHSGSGGGGGGGGSDDVFSHDNAAIGWLAADAVGMRGSFCVLQDQLEGVSVRTKGAFADSGVTGDDMEELCERVSALTGRDKSGHD